MKRQCQRENEDQSQEILDYSPLQCGNFSASKGKVSRRELRCFGSSCKSGALYIFLQDAWLASFSRSVMCNSLHFA